MCVHAGDKEVAWNQALACHQGSHVAATRPLRRRRNVAGSGSGDVSRVVLTLSPSVARNAHRAARSYSVNLCDPGLVPGAPSQMKLTLNASNSVGASEIASASYAPASGRAGCGW